jgi:2-polyprenyl-3-methyl-5-hydroxy-6-metoxy-1,4-benzoquinol methylase
MNTQMIHFVTRRACPACTSAQSVEVLCLRMDDDKITKYTAEWYENRVPQERFDIDSFIVLECQNCSLLYTKDHLDDDGMRALYDQWIKSPSIDEPHEARLQLVRRSVNLIAALVKNRSGSHIRVLDFGAGLGYWAREAKSRGYQVRAVELSPTRVNQMIERHGIDASQTLRDDDREFDFVYISQVLEHLSDPLSILNDISVRCCKGAILLVGVPNGSRTRANLRAGMLDFIEIDPLEHINCFAAKSMSAMMRQVGFRDARPTDARTLYGKGVLLGLAAHSRITGAPGRFFVKD